MKRLTKAQRVASAAARVNLMNVNGGVRVRVRTTHMTDDDIDYVVRRLLRQANKAGPKTKKRFELLEHAKELQRYRQLTEQGPDGMRRMKAS